LKTAGLGRNVAYLGPLVRHLDDLGSADDYIHRLHDRTSTCRISPADPL